jgi:hypothetical protein
VAKILIGISAFGGNVRVETFSHIPMANTDWRSVLSKEISMPV